MIPTKYLIVLSTLLVGLLSSATAAENSAKKRRLSKGSKHRHSKSMGDGDDG